MLKALLTHDEARAEEFAQELGRLQYEFEKVHCGLKTLRREQHDPKKLYFTDGERASDDLVSEKCDKLRKIFEKVYEDMKKFRIENAELKSQVLLPIAQGSEFEEAVVDEPEMPVVEKPKETVVIDLTDESDGEAAEVGESSERVSAADLSREIDRLWGRIQQMERDLELKARELNQVKAECDKKVKGMKEMAICKIRDLQKKLHDESIGRKMLERQLQEKTKTEREDRCPCGHWLGGKQSVSERVDGNGRLKEEMAGKTESEEKHEEEKVAEALMLMQEAPQVRFRRSPSLQLRGQ